MAWLGFGTDDWGLIVLALYLMHTAYVLAQAAVGRRLGLTVEELAVGFGPALLRWRLAGTRWRLGVIPLGAYTQFAAPAVAEEVPWQVRPLDGGPAAGRAVQDLGLAELAGLLVVGPVAAGLIGLAFYVTAETRTGYVLGMLGFWLFASNLAPLPPVLNGGVLALRCWEAATGRKVPIAALTAMLMVSLPVLAVVFGWFMYRLFTEPYFLIPPYKPLP